MKKIYLLKQNFALSIALLFFVQCIQAQTNIFPSTGSAGIGTTTPNASALLEMISTSKGLLIPRMTKTQRDNIAITPPTGLLVFQTNSTPGFYYYDGSAWTAVTPKTKGWSLTGNGGTNPANNFLGTTDAQPLVFKVNNQKAGYIGTSLTSNTGFGYQTLNANTSGVSNTANGFQAMYSNTSGGYNSANGVQALYANTTGNTNTANGFWALFSNTTGYYNTASGAYALQNNIAGIGNTANGTSALRNTTSGNENTGIGLDALFTNTTGYSNIAVGTHALFNNIIGRNNIAIGDSALYNYVGYVDFFGSITGFNTAVGSKTLYNNTGGNFNTATGCDALYNNTNGGANTSFGFSALLHTIAGSYNTAVGAYADVSGDYDNSSAFGYGASITASNQVRIGYSSVTSIGGYANWSNISDGRVKKNIKENVPGLAFINKLNAVTYNLDLTAADKIVQRPAIKDKDGKIMQPSAEELTARNEKQQIVYTGFVAQDVEKVAKSLNYDFSGVDKPKNEKDLYGLRYAEFVVPLVKAVQELSAKNDDLQKQINDLKAMISSGNQTDAGSTSNIKLQTSNISSTSLQQNAPNPFSNTTTISYSLPKNFSSAQIIITDKSGKVLKQVNLAGSGKGSVQLNASTLLSGAYQYSLLVDGKLIDTKQMILIK